MGLIKDIVVSSALDKVINKLDERSEKNEKKLFKKPLGAGLLLIEQDSPVWRKAFVAYDENRHVKYTVKGKLASRRYRLSFYDVHGNLLGTIKENARSPFSLDVEINGMELGKVRFIGWTSYEVCFNGWRIESNVLGTKYKILNGKEEIAKISWKWHDCGGSYVVNYADMRNELLMLMLVLTVDAAKAQSARNAARSSG